MTDLDKIIEIFDDMEVGYKLNENGIWKVIVLQCTNSHQHVTEFMFDKKGTFISKKKNEKPKPKPKPVIKTKINYSKLR